MDADSLSLTDLAIALVALVILMLGQNLRSLLFDFNYLLYLRDSLLNVNVEATEGLVKTVCRYHIRFADFDTVF